MDLIHWDIAIFHFINHDLSNPILDWLLPMWRNSMFWIPLYIFIVGFIFINFGRRAYWIVIFILLTVSTSDLVSSRAIKYSVKRIRPCNTTSIQAISRVPCGSGYSFTSSHAANHFAIATFLVLTLGFKFRKIRNWLWLWAGSIAFAQVYVGVHFPLDVIAGSLLGIIIGKLWAILFHRYYGDTIPLYNTDP
ncbi:MAG: phosphatase PAP2 family protein [Saprospiraceae bacterium]